MPSVSEEIGRHLDGVIKDVHDWFTVLDTADSLGDNELAIKAEGQILNLIRPNWTALHERLTTHGA